jgi:hypothetical protein
MKRREFATLAAENNVNGIGHGAESHIMYEVAEQLPDHVDDLGGERAGGSRRRVRQSLQLSKGEFGKEVVGMPVRAPKTLPPIITSPTRTALY